MHLHYDYIKTPNNYVVRFFTHSLLNSCHTALFNHVLNG